MQIAFVAGATGYTGREVVRLLSGRGVRTVAHVRPDSPRVEEWRRRFETEGAAVDVTPWDDAEINFRIVLRLENDEWRVDDVHAVPIPVAPTP